MNLGPTLAAVGASLVVENAVAAVGKVVISVHIAQSSPMHNQGITIFAKKTIAQFQPVFPSLWTANTIAAKIF